jgi:broad specificity phosphatase PhoE
MSTLLLIRHGQASYGQADYDRLSAVGEQQARTVGRLLAGEPALDALYTGPLRRQVQTGAFAVEEAAGALPAPTVLPELAEYPAFEMLRELMPRLVAHDPKFAAVHTAPTPALLDAAFKTVLAHWASGTWTHDAVERADAFIARIRAGLERAVRAASSGARIAIVTSGGPIGVAVGLTFGVSEERMIRTGIVVRNASITELKFRSADFACEPDKLSLFTFNSVAHLPPALRTDR